MAECPTCSAGSPPHTHTPEAPTAAGPLTEGLCNIILDKTEFAALLMHKAKSDRLAACPAFIPRTELKYPYGPGGKKDVTVH